MPDDLLPVLKALPRKHQHYLLAKYENQLFSKPKLRTLDQRLAKLANVLGPQEVNKYRNVYLDRPSKYIAFFESSPNVDGTSIEKTIARHHPRWDHPAEPNLGEDVPPQFNTMRSLPDGSLSIDFVSQSAEKLIPAGYGFVRGYGVNHDYVVVHPTKPAIIEINGRTTEHIEMMIASFAKLLRSKREDFTERIFDRPGQWKDLQKALDAQIFGHQANRSGKGEPAAYSMHAKRGEKLDDIAKFKALQVDHSDARELAFWFSLPLDIDGYPEEAFYYINIESGQIKFPDELTEHARRRIRDEFLAIARRG